MKALLILFCLGISTAFAQQPTQTVRGKVFDSESQFQLIGAKVQIFTADSTKKYRALTNPDGEFTIPNIPVGKHELVVTYLMYDTKTITIAVNSGKETVVEIPMQESFVEKEAVVVSGRKKGEVINELALISAQQFSVEETDRYPGSRSDPARMASNFAGVGGADDSRNDIVIRGNSPLGVVWRVEGIDIPNPSHFSISGSTGGPVSILNNKILANSDFFMSAFPAEYGNSTSGVFDLKLRKGNNKKHEFTGQFGFLGTELMAEGPMGKDGKASYLAMGRYSTLSMFQALGIQIGTDAVPVYGDGAFKFNWKLKNGGALSLFAIGGASNIDILIADPGTLEDQIAAGTTTEAAAELYGEGDRHQHFGTAMGVAGLTYKKPLNEKTFLATTVAYSYEQQKSNHDFIDRSGVDTLGNQYVVHNGEYPLMAYAFKTSKASAFFSINHKINKKHLIKAGINVDGFFYNMHDSVLEAGHNLDTSTHVWDERWDYEGASVLVQPFVQWKWRMSKKMAFTAGLHSQYFSMSNSISPVEPRIGWKLNMKNGQAISAGAGMHSMTQPMYTYLYHQEDSLGNKVYENKDMDFSRSLHTGIGYEKAFKKSMSLKFEAYYQHLYNIPVTVAPSAFSLINMGSGFQRFFPQALQNTGTGTNYGAEITLQKFFDKSFFFLFSGTVYNSTYVASDGEERSTSYNGNYVFNLLAGKEWKLGEKQSISFGLKATVAGGKLYGTVDTATTNALQELVYLDEGFNERQFPMYYRVDAKINWKYNARRVTHEIGLDLVNVSTLFTGHQNLLGLSYAPDLFDSTAEPVQERYQLGFLPLFYYKIDFRFDGK